MKILLVDDHAVVRQGYAALLRVLLPDVQVIEACDGEEALARTLEVAPSLVIMDVGLPGISGVETTRRLLQRLPQLRVLFFSMHDELPLVRQALDAGASGYITKSSSPEVLLDAVRRTLAGHAYIEQTLATQLARNPVAANAQDPRLQGMTQREFEIFVMLAKGTPARLIAERLCISGKTVSNYLTLLKSKLQVSSHAELVHLAIDTGIVRVGDRAAS
ncbi:DNA-binding response regulator [Pseudomonas sp. Choline-3u-10]|jgi:two-component system, NarL family, invasion response regulator UvrY|uniref:response regulator n=1 Tax=Pseudomonadaceae TaxID=135621 RepID=UPI000617E2ED|nr:MULTISPECIES: response regulator transcription factor [Pseudomonadaceae]MAL38239.1 DNA-binding response regulator [Pseudomonas sp.]MBU0950813.1 response regulator transcription factor [Gammaproteobacteria bacterium]KJJ65174.1 LuxR family transcriptional regulator [Pseudomonas sp. 10B238]MBK3795602.1 response regulator [Stutzerimonas stutzeri]MBK3878043.1 response regulator [Stutzerimonas stutzeri]|tara:strand:+ start:5021 stop:5674 length:654 start_codon:yes stop_codon:yes gene_type:complete